MAGKTPHANEQAVVGMARLGVEFDASSLHMPINPASYTSSILRPSMVSWVWGVLQVMSLRPRFQAAAQQAQNDGASEDDIEAIKGMARLFAELGESYVGLLAQGVC